jgi:hypothetical protein
MGISLRQDADALGLNPLEKLLYIHDKALDAFEKGRGYGDKSDAGTGYLSIAAQVMVKIAHLYYPSFVGIKAQTESESGLPKEPVDSAKALLAVLNDPFARRAANVAIAQVGNDDRDPSSSLPSGAVIDSMVDELKGKE